MIAAATARRRAQGCFAIARSTPFAKERETALSRGISIAEKAGLSLDQFDIPGRPRPAPRPSATGGRPPVYTAAEAAEAMRRFHENSVRSAADLHEAMMTSSSAGRPRFFVDDDIRPDESYEAARRRAFDEAIADAKRRDQLHEAKAAFARERRAELRRANGEQPA